MFYLRAVIPLDDADGLVGLIGLESTQAMLCLCKTYIERFLPFVMKRCIEHECRSVSKTAGLNRSPNILVVCLAHTYP